MKASSHAPQRLAAAPFDVESLDTRSSNHPLPKIVLHAASERIYPSGWSADPILARSPVSFSTAVRDRIESLTRRLPLRFRWIEAGDLVLDQKSVSVAIYVHFARSNRVSRMVLKQLQCYAAHGFKVVFVTMCNELPKTDIDRLRPLSSHIICRRNFGLDFGAWRDVLGSGLIPQTANELLLVNDSMLGPIRSLEPLFSTMRSLEGLWGLTNSVQWGAHLQSYFLLARGRLAVEESFRFFQSLTPSSHKDSVIERGELGFSKVMMERGVPLYAVFGLSSIHRVMLEDTCAWREVADSIGFRFDRDVIELDEKRMLIAREVAQNPINPTHQLAHILLDRFDFPFLKTELIRLNPCKMSLVAEWRRFVREDSDCDIDTLVEHLCIV